MITQVLTMVITLGVFMLIAEYIKRMSKPEEMWEILVPASNKMLEFSYEHHKAWDEFVISISGGITIMKTVKGEWISPDNVRFKDRMIPVRIKCDGDDIERIVDFTIKHYKQEAVLAYRISDNVILKNKGSE